MLGAVTSPVVIRFLSTLSLRRATFACWYIKEMTANISIHALLAESDSLPSRPPANRQTFLSTLSLRRATFLCCPVCVQQHHFYPRSPCGERPVLDALSSDASTFLSTLSLRRATPVSLTPLLGRRYFYPRSPCGERPRSQTVRLPAFGISIHALLAESDWIKSSGAAVFAISIHALLAESDFACWYIKEMTANISIHALLAESDPEAVPRRPHAHISIHALLAESDQ